MSDKQYTAPVPRERLRAALRDRDHWRSRANQAERERDEARAERDCLREALQAILEVPSHAFDMATVEPIAREALAEDE